MGDGAAPVPPIPLRDPSRTLAQRTAQRRETRLNPYGAGSESAPASPAPHSKAVHSPNQPQVEPSPASDDTISNIQLASSEPSEEPQTIAVRTRSMSSKQLGATRHSKSPHSPIILIEALSDPNIIINEPKEPVVKRSDASNTSVSWEEALLHL